MKVAPIEPPGAGGVVGLDRPVMVAPAPGDPESFTELPCGRRGSEGGEAAA